MSPFIARQKSGWRPPISGFRFGFRWISGKDLGENDFSVLVMK